MRTLSARMRGRAVDQALRQRLERLHTELARADTVDAESRVLLITLLDDITRLLERSDQSPERRAAEQHSLRERLDGQAVRFEAEHPALGAALRQVVDTLAKAGI